MATDDDDDAAQRLERLFDAYADRVHAFATHWVGPNSARDVVSETFLVAWRRFDTVPDRALPWLLGTARKVISNELRGRARRSALRVARPPETTGWAASPEGRNVLADVIASPRGQSGPSPRRPYLKPLVAAAVAVLVVVGAVAGIRLLGGHADIADTYRAGDIAFFGGERSGGGAVSEVEHYDSIESAAKAASAVIVAEVIDVRHTRTVYGEERSWDRFHMVGLVLRPVEVLRGDVPDEFAQELTVEFMHTVGPPGTSDPGDVVQRQKASLPEGRSVWFLRSKAEEGERLKAYLAKQGKDLTKQELAMMEAEKPYYRLTSSHGLFVQGEHHVVNPVAFDDEATANTMLSDVESYRKLSELIAAIRDGR